MSSTPRIRPWPSSSALRLSVVPADEYVRAVLPHSQTLWAGRRTAEEYADEWRAAAASGYGRRRVRTFALRDGAEIVASFKRYDRDAVLGATPLRAVGIGAVFTPPAYRGRGYATAMLGAALDAAREEGYDVAYLFSDIEPAFYESLGFLALPSRTFVTRADRLPSSRVVVEVLGAGDADAMRRCFEATDAARPFALSRTPLVWSWMRLRAGSREHDGAPVALGIRNGRALDAYVLGRRVPRADAFVLDELAVIDPDDAPLAHPLLRAAAGDLGRISGWLPPGIARLALPRAAIRRRSGAIAMLAPLNRTAEAAWGRAAAAIAASPADPLWAADAV